MPNPARDFILLQHPNERPISVEIIGLDGRVLKKEMDLANGMQTRIGLDGLPQGIYLLRIGRENGGKEILKFSKSN
jgi:hypothetical protein